MPRRVNRKRPACVRVVGLVAISRQLPAGAATIAVPARLRGRKLEESMAGAVAKGLNLARNTTATRLPRMSKSGEIKKASRGYTAR